VKAQRIRNEHKVTAKEVTEVFLRELWTASLSQAADEFGLAVHQLQDTPFLVSMGVPANWSRDTVRDLREAADLAGIPGSHAQSDFSFLSEPEADLISFIEGHAISTDFTVSPHPFAPPPPPPGLQTSNYEPVSDHFQKGDIIGICDVGGGTIVSFPLFVPDGSFPTNT
jgi:molecular chaperone DnaK (HSP70)